MKSVFKSIQYCSGPTEEATIALSSFNKVDGMSPEGWNESDLGVGVSGSTQP